MRFLQVTLPWVMCSVRREFKTTVSKQQYKNGVNQYSVRGGPMQVEVEDLLSNLPLAHVTNSVVTLAPSKMRRNLSVTALRL